MNTLELSAPGGRAIKPVAGLPPPEHGSDLERLLERALLAREEGAFAEAVRRLRPAMVRIALRHVRSPEDAEDVIQDAWLAALDGAPRFEGRSLLSTWLLRILSYRARTMGRRASRSIPLSQVPAAGKAGVESAEPLFTSRPTSPDDAAGAREMREALARALRELAPRQRRVFSLRDLSGLSAAHVCERLGISAGNERVLLHRARTQLRRRLAGHWGRVRRVPARDSEGHGGWRIVLHAA